MQQKAHDALGYCGMSVELSSGWPLKSQMADCRNGRAPADGSAKARNTAGEREDTISMDTYHKILFMVKPS